MISLIKFITLSLFLSLSTTAWAEDIATQDAAIQGDEKAQAKLGAMHLLGNNEEKDPQKAFEWFLKAAGQGQLESQVIIAAMYDSGVGVKHDVKAATAWYEKAAAKGHQASMALLGKNPIAKGGIAFNYQAMRLSASKQIPNEYAKKILFSQ